MDARLESRRTHYFLQVLDSGSVRGAASALGMDPSAISRAVSQLEQECGVALIERKGRGVAPTDAGRLLADFLRRQISEKQGLLAQMDSIRKVESGHVDIMTGEGYVRWLMRGSLRRFMQQHPQISISLNIGGTDEIVRDVIDERAHIGLMFHPPKDGRLRSHHAFSNPIQTMTLRSHPLASLNRPLRLADLAPWPGAMLHPSFGLRQHIQAAEVSEGVRLNVAFTTASFEALGQFVLGGHGYSLASRLSMSPGDRERVAFLPMKNALLQRGRSHVITREGRLLPPAAVALLRHIVGDMKSA
ncbi:LysR family transcriptional regulator [Camelimonas sp. ID_303_24]